MRNKKQEKFPNIDWYCDNCNAYLSSQSGFYDSCGSWACTKCSHINSINKNEIIFDNDTDNDDFDNLLSDPGCAACGNPAYPNCKISCPLFDE